MQTATLGLGTIKSKQSSSSHRRNKHAHLAIRKDTNPATYYTDQLQKERTPLGFTSGYLNPPKHSRNMNFSSSIDDINVISLSPKVNSNKSSRHVGSKSMIDLSSWKEHIPNPSNSSALAFIEDFNLMDNDEFNIHDNDQFNNHDEFAINPNGSSSNLWENASLKHKNNKQQYKRKKIKNNIVNYMKYISIDDDIIGYDCDQEGQSSSSPSPIPMFTSVDDIFKLTANKHAQSGNILKPYDTSTSDDNDSDGIAAADDPSAHIENSSSRASYDLDLNLDLNDDNMTNTASTSSDDGEEIDVDDITTKHKILRELRAVLNHNVNSDDIIHSDSDTRVFASINNLINDLDDKTSKINNISHNINALKEENKLLKQDIQSISNKSFQLNDIQNDLNRLQNENISLKHQNNKLINQLTLKEITTKNILIQLNEYLLDVKNEIHDKSDNNDDNCKDISMMYINTKNKLESIHDSIHDLANDIDCDDLYMAADRLNKSMNDINYLQQNKLYEYDNIVFIVNNLLKDLNINTTTPHGTPNGYINTTPSGTTNGYVNATPNGTLNGTPTGYTNATPSTSTINGTPNGFANVTTHGGNDFEMKYPELLCDIHRNDKNLDKNQNLTPKQKRKQKSDDYDDDDKKYPSTPGGNYVFNDDYPMIIRIDIDGGFFNKKSRAIIKYKNQIFGRKMADFKWLISMLESHNKIIPQCPKEQPPLLWTVNYLNQRKNELNIFLMHCHSLNNIKNSIPYNIFLTSNKKNWKQKRNEFDKRILIKNKH